MVEILSYIFWVLLAITILVFVHEMGHFLMAKLFNMRVDRFSIGFPPKLVGKKVGETEYVVGATPLGGYVKIAGMIDESMDTEHVQRDPDPREFRAKPVWQRIVVITAGVVFNVILAAVIFTSLKMAYGESYIPAENVEAIHVADSSIAYRMGLRTGDRLVAVSGEKMERYSNLVGDLDALLADSMTVTVERNGRQRTFEGPTDIMTQLSQAGRKGFGISFEPAIAGRIVEGSAAEEAGLQPGDRIVSIEGDSVRFWAQMTEKIEASQGEPMTFSIQRPDSLAASPGKGTGLPPPAASGRGYVTLEKEIAPRRAEDGRYVLGVYGLQAAPELFEREFGTRYRSYGVGGALTAGLGETWSSVENIAVSLQRIFTGREDFRENVGGPVMIAKVTKEAAEVGPSAFWNLVAMLSITLAIMNILPIPALDGGHLVFLIYEGITRRAPSLRVRMALQQIGMVLLLVFMVFVIFNDILRL